jgi:hypothetical protein
MKLHVTKEGDTFAFLAETYGVEVDRIIEKNPLVSELEQIAPGTKVKIPSTPIRTVVAAHMQEELKSGIVVEPIQPTETTVLSSSPEPTQWPVNPMNAIHPFTQFPVPTTPVWTPYTPDCGCVSRSTAPYRVPLPYALPWVTSARATIANYDPLLHPHILVSQTYGDELHDEPQNDLAQGSVHESSDVFEHTKKKAVTKKDKPKVHRNSKMEAVRSFLKRTTPRRHPLRPTASRPWIRD